ncbi:MULTISPECIES: DUF2514 domain-containing protein [Pseudomonas]|uniref:DUF2514 domain-containing protein n=1 Tax=Pseudomonas TaxID=286 RepID=UPI002579C7F5|nr:MULTISPECIES: DUF2514 domain-containing protein [Pseudomonas]MDP9539275.1 DUF2514 domain-containing protein [Pseudomonas putida]MDV5386616.1 DUF2514 domain-containing protein [Pseudomonas juntendi]
MNWLDAVPGWCWWLIALVLVTGGQQYRVVVADEAASDARAETAKTEKTLADFRLEVSERDRRVAAQARQEEQRRAEAQEEARAHAQEERTIADAGAADADAAGQRLRSDASQLAAAVSCTGPDTAAVARGQAATRAAMVLSDLLTRADARAGELAKAYDRARVAGGQCEREYDLLIGPQKAGL